MLLVTIVLRSYRWRLLLQPVPGLRLSQVFGCLNVGYFMNNVLPFQMGELGRVYMLGEIAGISTTRSLSSVVVERMIDLLTLLVFLMLLAPFAPVPAAARIPAVMLALACIVAAVALVAASRGRGPVPGIVERLLRLAPPASRPKLRQMADNAISGFAVMIDPRTSPRVAALSVVAWLSVGFIYYLGFQAFHMSLGYDAAVILAVATTLGFFFPSSPGRVRRLPRNRDRHADAGVRRGQEPGGELRAGDAPGVLRAADLHRHRVLVGGAEGVAAVVLLREAGGASGGGRAGRLGQFGERVSELVTRMPNSLPAPQRLLARTLSIYASGPFAIFAAFFVICGATVVGYMNSLDGSQYALTRSLAERQTVFIGGFANYANPDYALGRHSLQVSDREAGQSVIGVPFHFLGRALTPLSRLPYNGHHENLSNETKTQVITYLSLVFLVSLGLSYAYTLLKALDISGGAAAATCLLIGFGTLMFKYSASYSRQPAVAVLLLILLLELLVYDYQRSPKNLLIAGIAGGLAIFCDYLAAIPVLLCLAAIAIKYKRTPAHILALASGIGFFTLVSGLYNFAAFGTPFTSPHQHEANITFITHLDNNFHTPVLQGLYLNLFAFTRIPASSVTWLLSHPELVRFSLVDYAVKTTYKGIVVQSPFLIMALVGWGFYLWRKPSLLILLGCMTLPWLVIMSTFTLFYAPQNFDTRYLLPVVPIVAVGLAFLLDGLIRAQFSGIRAITLGLFCLLALISFYFAWESSVTNFPPSLSGTLRWAPQEMFKPIVTAQTAWTAFTQTFPNVYNIHVLVALAFVLYGLSVAVVSILSATADRIRALNLRSSALRFESSTTLDTRVN